MCYFAQSNSIYTAFTLGVMRKNCNYYSNLRHYIVITSHICEKWGI